MPDVREQLLKLVRIQELVVETQEAATVIEGAPGRIEAAEQLFRERNAEYVATKERHDGLEADRRARSEELAVLEESRKKYMDSLMQVKNQREYAAALKEIDIVKARISENEDAVLKAMEELETLKSDMESRAAHIETERAMVEKERSEVEAQVVRSHEVIARCEAERAEIERELPGDLARAVRRVEQGRGGLFLVKTEHELCTACHVRVRPQVYQEIKQATRIHTCSSCKRFLYFESAVRLAPRESSPNSRGLDAVNGGPA